MPNTEANKFGVLVEEACDIDQSLFQSLYQAFEPGVSNLHIAYNHCHDEKSNSDVDVAT